MKVPVMRLGKKEPNDSAFGKNKAGGIVIIFEYNLDELLEYLRKGTK